MHRKRIFRRQSTWPTKVSCGAIVEIRLLVGLKDVGGPSVGLRRDGGGGVGGRQARARYALLK